MSTDTTLSNEETETKAAVEEKILHSSPPIEALPTSQCSDWPKDEDICQGPLHLCASSGIDNGSASLYL